MTRASTDLAGSDPATMEAYFGRLWPLLRSLTGEGARRTHDILVELLPLERTEIATGTRVFDWEIPPEWVVREAYVIAPDGRRILDVAQNNLHLVNYSAPFRGRLSRGELDAHLHSLPALPTAIPYVTSYYAPRWGFCLPDAERRQLPEGTYEVVVDTALVAGSMTLSEAVLPGESDREILFSTYTCHPSLANNELSGPLVAAFLYRRLAAMPRRRHTVRFAFVPETIGAIAYLAQRGEHFRARLDAGYVVTCIGTKGPAYYKRSQRGATAADRAATHVLAPGGAKVIDFVPSPGSDERQYCSPGFDLPVGVLSRTFVHYPEYHTSLDNKSIIDFGAMSDMVGLCVDICRTLDDNRTYRGTVTHGEPFLSRHGLQSTVGAKRDRDLGMLATKWVLNQSNGDRDLLSIAERSGLDLATVAEAARRCEQAGLLQAVAA